MPLAAAAQTTLTGRVIGERGAPAAGVMVSLENTLDGTVTDSAGGFTLVTTETGPQTLVVGGGGIYEESRTRLTILPGAPPPRLDILLRKDPRSIETVTVTAGAFTASGDGEKTVLKPLDIVTTAGAQADVVRTFQLLPGVQQPANTPGLFVRGGDASEAAIVVDGLVVQNAFFAGPPGAATRSRFQPFAFKGYAFSSGGYSARYGQALSSVLELNTLDLPERSTVNLGANMAGVYASASRLWEEKAGVEVTASYNNLQPFYGIANTNFDFYDVPKGGTASAKWAWKPCKDGLLKVMGNWNRFSSGTGVPDPAQPGRQIRFGIRNTTGWGTASYRHTIGTKWTLFTALLYSANKDDNTFDGTTAGGDDRRAQLRAEARRQVTARLSILAGFEGNRFSYSRVFGKWNSTFTETQGALYGEARWSPTRSFSIVPGVRVERSGLLDQTTASPRIAAAIRAGKWGSVGLATGLFYQLPDVSYLLVGARPDQQRAVHAIANYTYSRADRTLRLEAYYKDYDALTRETQTTGMPFDPNPFRNPFGVAITATGYGYAQGAELFWRDRKTVKNTDYWISYSYIDTRRLYRNFPVEATPDFVADHNASFVGKYWIEKWQTNVNATYSFATGRPYYNPQNTEFLADRTPAFHNLAMTVNYLTSIGKWFTVVYAGVDNLTNRKNVFGYRYSADGQQRWAQVPALYRSYFVGINLSLTEFDKDEL